MAQRNTLAESLETPIADYQPQSRFELVQGRVNSFLAQSGQVVRVREGAIWLTFGTVEDVILGACERFIIAERSLVVVQAISDAVFTVE